MTTLRELGYVLSLNAQEFLKVTRKAQADYNDFRKDAQKPVKVSADGVKQLLGQIAAITAAYVGLNAAQRAARQFQTDIANVASLNVDNLEELSAGALRVGADVPAALGDVTAALYEVVSAGVDASNQIDVLDTSARAGVAGVSTATDALALGSAVIKGYGKDWEDFESILDQAFKTVELGQTNFGALAGSVGKVVPFTNALKVDTEELFGAYATLTGVTGNTNEVTTQLKALFQELSRPTANLSNLVEDLTGMTTEQATAQLGLAGILEIVSDATGGSAAKMNELFSSSESVTALLALTTSQYDTFTDKTNQMRDATGAMSDAFETQSETVDSQLQILENRFSILAIGLLEGVLPAITVTVENIGAMVQWFSDLDDGSQKLLITIGLVTVAFFKLPPALAAVRVALQGLQGAIGPAGWLVLGISAAATVLTVFTAETKNAEAAAGDLAESNRDLASSFDEVREAARKELELESQAALIAEQEELEQILQQNIVRLAELQEQINNPVESTGIDLDVFTTGESAAERQKRETQEVIEDARARLAAIADILDARRKIQQDAAGALSADELAEIDKRQAFLFRSNRLSLQDYLAYLESRRDALRESLGEESIEFLKFEDRLADIRTRLLEQNAEPVELGIRTASVTPTDFIDEIISFHNVETNLRGLRLQDLESEYGRRRQLLQENLELARNVYGEESEEYLNQLSARAALERSHQENINEIRKEAAAATITLGAQLLEAFQGNNKTLFNVGKTASIAQATISTYEAVTRAYKDYPFPFNIGVAAIQGALGFAQVAKIRSTNFQPAGKATGGRVNAGDLMRSAVLTPPGEDGIIGIQAGEYVVNRDATARMLPLLEAINSNRFFGAFQNGGRVSGSTSNSGGIGVPGTAGGFGGLIDAIRQIQIVINANMDGLTFLRQNYPDYERLKRKNEIST